MDFASIANLLLIVALAAAIEGLVEWLLGTAFDRISVLTPHKWALIYPSALFGVLVAFYWNLDLFSVLAGTVLPGGIAITGLLIGRGANYVHQFLKKYVEPDFPALEG